MGLDHAAIAESIPGRALMPGRATGPVLKLAAPLSFWGGVDPRTGGIILGGHPDRGTRVGGRILVIPELVGSSSSSAVMLELLHAGRAPLGVVVREPDAILCLGVVVASEMGWPTIPVVQAAPERLRTGQTVRLEPDGRIQVLAAGGARFNGGHDR